MAGHGKKGLEAELVHVGREGLLRLGIRDERLESVDDFVRGAVCVGFAIQGVDGALCIGDERFVDVVLEIVGLGGGEVSVDGVLDLRLGGFVELGEAVVVEAERAPLADGLGGIFGPLEVAFGGGIGEAELYDEAGEETGVLIIHIRAVAGDKDSGETLLSVREIDAKAFGGVLDVFRRNADVHFDLLFELEGRRGHHAVNVDGGSPFEAEG